MYITFTVEVRDEKYQFSGTSGKAESEVQVPDELIEVIEVGEIFEYLVKCAFVNYHKDRKEKDKEEE